MARCAAPMAFTMPMMRHVIFDRLILMLLRYAALIFAYVKMLGLMPLIR